MAGIDIQNIIDINFNIKQSTQPLTSYSTVVYAINNVGNFDGNNYKVYTEPQSYGTDSLPNMIIDNINYYFRCGGKKLLVSRKFISNEPSITYNLVETYNTFSTVDQYIGYYVMEEVISYFPIDVSEFTTTDDYLGHYILDSDTYVEVTSDNKDSLGIVVGQLGEDNTPAFNRNYEYPYTEVTESNKNDLGIIPGSTAAFIQVVTYDDYILQLKQEKFGTDEDFIYVVPHSGQYGYEDSVIANAEQTIIKYKAPYKVRLLETTTSIPGANPIPKNSSVVAIKYAPSTIKFADEPDITYLNIDTALSIGAYYSQLYIYDQNTIRDYCYTNESDIIAPFGIPDISQSDYDSLSKAYINFDGRIGTQYYNFGGDLTTGVSLSVDFGGVACENAIATTVLEQILAKQYLTQGGLTNILNAINGVLVEFVNNGYIEQNSVYKDNTITITYGRQYTVVAKGEALPTGYKIFSIPMSNILPEDKQAKRFTPIYIVLMTVAGARTIKIEGDIIA